MTKYTTPFLAHQDMTFRCRYLRDDIAKARNNAVELYRLNREVPEIHMTALRAAQRELDALIVEIEETQAGAAQQAEEQANATA